MDTDLQERIKLFSQQWTVPPHTLHHVGRERLSCILPTTLFIPQAAFLPSSFYYFALFPCNVISLSEDPIKKLSGKSFCVKKCFFLLLWMEDVFIHRLGERSIPPINLNQMASVLLAKTSVLRRDGLIGFYDRWNDWSVVKTNNILFSGRGKQINW